MNNLPSALRSVYTTNNPNQTILLYDGLLEISSHINKHPVQIKGNGKLEYIWFPNSCINFKFFNQDQDIDKISCAHVHNYPISLTLVDIGISVDVSIAKCSSGGNDGNFVSGKIKKPVVQGKGQDLAYVLFHVVNFYDFIEKPISLLEQDSSQWKLTLDQLETTANNSKSLNSQGGFAITHVGKLEKLDGQTFSEEEATEFLGKFADFLSFARGFRVPLILLVGYDAEDNEIWQHWDSSVGHSWKSVDSWFPTNKAKILADVFPGFLRWWNDWEESARLALYYYLEANAIPTVEIKIVLTQIALELMAKKEGQTKGNASEKLRGLIVKHKIPGNMPFDRHSNKSSAIANTFRPQSSNLVEKLIELKSKLEEKLKKKLEKGSNDKHKQKIKKELGPVDAPYLFTQIRNDIVHSKKKIENFEDYLFEASDLGLWYLELVLLAIFGYQGCYCNRLLRYQQNGDTESVPWSHK